MWNGINRRLYSRSPKDDPSFDLWSCLVDANCTFAAMYPIGYNPGIIEIRQTETYANDNT
jgi:hypothetical protein